ncbi:ABC transporter permease [Clostridium sp. SHJSY1]|uniref:ABC transporter permease n=1 Tax=Clostridium sp. SHJSY1 TaxID=2942483 RepID=UPI0028748EE7|nr:ABC transporter permease [Clostridium sp. SHJSY1]MDS0525520.1 ABC transporter permease [Clostridium sp. SHJSY1]
MKRVFKIMALEIKRKRFLLNLMISFFLVSCILFLNYFLSKNLSVMNLKDIPIIYLRLISYVMLVNCSFSLTQEFTNKTDKIIFTGIFTRNEIMISKLISFWITGIISFVFYEIISIICGTFNLNIIFSNFISFFIYSFTLGSFILLISGITTNFIITGIVGYLLYFDLILVLFNQALASSTNEILKYVIEKIPFYIANTGFYLGNYTGLQSIIMAASGMLFLIVACVIINRKNM